MAASLDPPNLCPVWLITQAVGCLQGQRSVGIAFANLTSRALGACEFADDEQFCALEAVLLQVAAKEVVVATVSLGYIS